MSSDTPEMWVLHKLGDGLGPGPTTGNYAIRANGVWIFETVMFGSNNEEADGLRACACVNALAGIDDPEAWVRRAKAAMEAAKP